MKPFDHILLSCEHATNHVPRQYRHLFAGHAETLDTHLGYDIGINRVADQLSQRLQCPLIKFPLSRLLLEPNRSQRHRLFSVYSQKLPENEKTHLIRTYYQPYRDSLRQQVVSALTTSKTVLHLSLHSFTPVLKGRQRTADVGLLYDPSRRREKSLAGQIQEQLVDQLQLRIRRNYPYLGTADGTVTWLRRQFRPQAYMGLEIEINQAWLLHRMPQQFRMLCEVLSDTLTWGRSDKSEPGF